MDESDSDNDHQLQSEDEDENEDEVEDEDDQPLTEEERIAAAAEDAETSRVVLLKVISILERKVTYPARTIKKIDDLVEDFFFKLEEDVHEMLCSNDADADADDGDYRGLDNNRDTEAEVEAIARVFPNILAERKTIANRFYYPIQCLAFTVHDADESSFIWGTNSKAVSFIPVVARLAIEFGCFEEEDRGGLLCYDNRSSDSESDNVLQQLMCSDPIERHNQEHHEHIDDTYLQVLVQLRKMGVFKKEDIQRYGLLEDLCLLDVFAEKRFRFLVEWNPTALTRFAMLNSIEGFRVVLEYGIRYYPNKKGICLLFKKEVHGKTPFQLACEEFGYKEVMKVVEDTLIRYSDTPINITEALIMAAIDQNIHLDCVYFLFRRHPDILHKISSSSSTPVVATAATNTSTTNNTYIMKLCKRKRGS